MADIRGSARRSSDLPTIWAACRRFAPASTTIRELLRHVGLPARISILAPCCIRRRLAAVDHLNSLGRPVVLSDGDVVFQPRKIRRAGIWDAVDGRVLDVRAQGAWLGSRAAALSGSALCDGRRQAPSIGRHEELNSGEKLTTVFVRQGHYALRRGSNAVQPPARPGDRAHRRSGNSQFIRLRGATMTADATPARSGSEPVARQHHPRDARQRHLAPLHRANCRSPD